MSDNYQLLLAKAAQLYEEHEVGCPEPFNVFSVLHKETDEVNLHSRFLHALLDYKKPGTETRENLKDFLQNVGVKDFELCDEKVERERYNIDILITNDRQAVVIENKSNPNRKDEDKQLWRYYSTLKDKGYSHSDIHMLYLTPNGHDPFPYSLGNLKKEEIIKIAYKGDLIQTWLERCQERACSEPELWWSVTQYLQLVRKLTRTDSRGKYMDALKQLCLENNNLVLVHDLNNVMLEAMREAVWNEIKAELRSEDPDFLDMEVNEYGLSYKLNEVSYIEVGAHGEKNDGRIWFGVYCSKKDHKHKYDKIKKSLKSFLDGGESDTEYPWWRYADTGYVDTDLNLKKPTREALEILSNEKKRKKVVRKVAQGLQELLEVIEDIAMVNAIEEGAKTGLASREQVFKILRGQE